MKDIQKYTTTEKAKTKTKKIQSDLNKIVKVNWVYKSEEQNRAIKNNKTLYQSRENVKSCLMVIQKFHLMQNIY